MKIVVTKQEVKNIKSKLIIKGYFQDSLIKDIKSFDKILKNKISKIVDMKDFSAKLQESFLFYSDFLTLTEKILIFGLGEIKNVDLHFFRKMGAWYAKATSKLNIDDVCIDITDMLNIVKKAQENKLSSLDTYEKNNPYNLCELAFEAFLEGLILSQYKYDKYKKQDDKSKPISRITLTVDKDRNIDYLNEVLHNVELICESNFHARDFANTPSSNLNPKTFSEEIKKVAMRCGMKYKLLSKKEIAKMGGLLGVGKGSIVSPRFAIVEHNSKKAPNTVVLVGKGITFDSGGISLKPSQGMAEMKMDMSGAAAVICTLEAASKLKLPIHLVGLIPLAENMPSGSALKPGDIVTISNGKTIEVDNTDAEGRLILADALVYANNYKPKLIIDLATLTGACVVALGHFAAGLFGNDKQHINKLIGFGHKVHERVWELPLYDDYAELIKSDVADIKNVGGRWAGASTAAIFLKNFVNDTPWMHLDIAGPAILEKETEIETKGGSGFGVRLLIEFLKDWTISYTS
jgi:leucyl aminopeptidase